MSDESTQLKSFTTDDLQKCIEEAISNLMKESYKAKISKIDYTKTGAKINLEISLYDSGLSLTIHLQDENQEIVLHP